MALQFKARTVNAFILLIIAELALVPIVNQGKLNASIPSPFNTTYKN
jgi:hypothetical protein